MENTNSQTLVIEIMQGDERPQSKTIRAGQPDAKTFYFHQAFAHLGGRFPVEMQLPAESNTHMIAAGKYVLAPQSFKINQYGGLEISRFDMQLIPLIKQQVKVA